MCHNSLTERTALLLGEEAVQRLGAASVLVVGVGGVGAYAAEMICRAGIGSMTIVDADCVAPSNINRQLPALRFWAKYNDRYLMADKDLTKPTEIEFCTGSFSAVDTAAFKAVGGFDEGYFMYVEDADLTQKMRTRGKAFLVPQYTAIHAWHRAAHRSLKPFLWQLRSLLRYFSKWGFAW